MSGYFVFDIINPLAFYFCGAVETGPARDKIISAFKLAGRKRAARIGGIMQFNP
jgi:hypothetical protein